VFSGKQKLAFAQRLRSEWQDIADYFDIPADQRHGFTTGREPHKVWDWLAVRNRLADLPAALRYIGREDIVLDVLEPPPPSAPVAAPTWQESSFPGLRSFTATQAGPASLPGTAPEKGDKNVGRPHHPQPQIVVPEAGNVGETKLLCQCGSCASSP
jgi:hypothetical protein